MGCPPLAPACEDGFHVDVAFQRKENRVSGSTVSTRQDHLVAGGAPSIDEHRRGEPEHLRANGLEKLLSMTSARSSCLRRRNCPVLLFHLLPGRAAWKAPLFGHPASQAVEWEGSGRGDWSGLLAVIPHSLVCRGSRT